MVFGKWHLANGKTIWQAAHFFVEFYLTSHEKSSRQNISEIKYQIFNQTLFQARLFFGIIRLVL